MKFSKTLVGITLMATMLVPSLSSAQSVGDLQAQLQALLKQVAALQAQIKAQQGETTTAWCHAFNANLKIGDNNLEVAYLRMALLKDGFLKDESSLIQVGDPSTENNFSESTAAAVVGFQQKYADEVLTPAGLKNGTGYVGNGTRNKLNKLFGCGPIVPPPFTASIKVLSPNGGETWTNGTNQTIRWQDNMPISTCPKGSVCAQGFPSPKYDITLNPYYPPCTGEICPAYDRAPYIIAKNVYGNSNNEYSYWNWLVGSGVGFDTVPGGPYTIQICRTGTDTCDSSNSYFKITNSAVGAPTISGVSGPTTLNVGGQGTWTITASDPANGTLNYSVVWGDEGYPTNSAQVGGAINVQQTAIFTHTYSVAGNYYPQFTVTNSAGLSAQTSLSVNVGGSTGTAVTVISPNNNEIFMQGQSNQITWSGLPLSQVDILLNKLDGTTLGYIYSHVFATGATVTNSVYWDGKKVSSNGTFSGGADTNVPPGRYKVLIRSVDGKGQDASDWPFTIASLYLQSMSPFSGPVGTRVTLAGLGTSGLTPTGNTVNFGGGVILNLSATGNQLTFTVPGSLDPACRFTTPVCAIRSVQTTPGVYSVSVTNANGTSNAMNFTVTDSSSAAAPTIYSASPSSGPINTQVTIYGSGFISGSKLNFGSISSYGQLDGVISSDGTRFTFNVPNQITYAAGCTDRFSNCTQAVMDVSPGVYPLSIVNSNGTSNAVNFTVTQASSALSVTTAPLGSVSRTQSFVDDIGVITFTVPPSASTDVALNQIRLTVLGTLLNSNFGVNDVKLFDTNGISTMGTITNSECSTGGTCTLVYTFNLGSGNSGLVVTRGSFKSFKVRVDSATHASTGSFLTLAAMLNSPSDVSFTNIGSGVSANPQFSQTPLVVNSVSYGTASTTPTISVNSPQKGDAWRLNSSQQINISTTNMPSTAKYDILLYSATSGNYPPVIFLQNSATLPNPLTIGVPNVPVGQYYIYARAVVGTTVYESQSGTINIVQIQTMLKNDPASQLASMSAILQGLLNSLR